MEIAYERNERKFYPISDVKKLNIQYEIIQIPNLTEQKGEIFEYFEYPFDYMDRFKCNSENQYGVYVPTIDSDIDQKYAENFCDNIKEIYFYQEGKYDEESWELIGRLNNGYYFYYTAWCDYTGFSCRGGMSLYLNNTLCDLLNYSVDISTLKELSLIK